jgi:hypothetical protein
MISTNSLYHQHKLTNNRLKAVLPIDGQASLARQLDRIHDIDSHLDHALHDHIVLLKLVPSQLCTLDIPRAVCSQTS